MKVQAPFGFVTGCHAGDKFMVQATLASMRHYCPEVPICLTVDGDVDVTDLEEKYNLIILRISKLPSMEMSRLIGGSFHAKQAAMWEGPFDFFIWIDSDAIVWGDFTKEIRTDLDFQILWSDISIPSSALAIPEWLPYYYFNPEMIRRFDKDFEWRGNAYFSAGVYACRRNSISFAEYTKIMTIQRENPGMFAFYDMGIINYLVHSKKQRGELNVEMTDLQHVWAYHGKAELIQDCLGAGWNFPVSVKRPRVAHFCGRKPWIFDRKSYSRPFTMARLVHHRTSHGELGAWIAILNEDCQVLAKKVKRRFMRFIKK